VALIAEQVAVVTGVELEPVLVARAAGVDQVLDRVGSPAGIPRVVIRVAVFDDSSGIVPSGGPPAGPASIRRATPSFTAVRPTAAQCLQKAPSCPYGQLQFPVSCRFRAVRLTW
jgi:hypothetical protein